MLKVGLTGGIGSGKTTVAKIFETLGVPIYYSDYWAKHLTNHNKKIINKLKQEFGEDIYLPDNKLNKSKLAGVIFNDKSKMHKVNSIIHPVVKTHFNKWLKQQNNEIKYIIKESAILFESGANKQIDKVIVVYTNKNLRISRLQKRDNISIDDINKKISSQMLDEEKLKLSDFIIYNNEKDLLLPQVLKLHNSLQL